MGRSKKAKVSIEFFRDCIQSNGEDYYTEDFRITGTAYHDEGNYSGPYENSYPAESEVNITQVLRSTAGKWEPVSVDVFSEKEIERIEYLMLQELHDMRSNDWGLPADIPDWWEA